MLSLQDSGDTNSNRRTNREFAESYTYAGHYNVPTSIRHTYYAPTYVKQAKVDLSRDMLVNLSHEGCINWYELKGFSHSELVNKLGREVGLHNLDLRDILTPVHVVKIDNDKDRFFLILNSCTLKENGKMAVNHMGMLVTPSLVATFTEADSDVFDSAHSALKENIMNIRSRKSGFLLAFLLNNFLTDQIETATHLESLLEDIERKLLGTKDTEGTLRIKIQRSRHAHLTLKKALIPLKEQFPKLCQLTEDITDEEMIPLFADLSDQLAYVLQSVDNSREILTSLVDLYVSQNDLRANAIMKHLTVVATLFIPITFLAGVWGMNFKIPEQQWHYGYLFAWGSMIVVALGTWLLMRRMHWF